MELTTWHYHLTKLPGLAGMTRELHQRRRKITLTFTIKATRTGTPWRPRVRAGPLCGGNKHGISRSPCGSARSGPKKKRRLRERIRNSVSHGGEGFEPGSAANSETAADNSKQQQTTANNGKQTAMTAAKIATKQRRRVASSIASAIQKPAPGLSSINPKTPAAGRIT
jgi:hypothetical protein